MGFGILAYLKLARLVSLVCTLYAHTTQQYNFINPQRMHEGYSGHSVCICESVTTLTATYLVRESKVLFYKVYYGIPNACIV